jgi:hypothetical protein
MVQAVSGTSEEYVAVIQLADKQGEFSEVDLMAL